MQKLNWKPNNELEKAGLKIVQLLNENKYQGFFVGGAVRDHILKRNFDNLDIATDALPDEVEKILDIENIYHKQIGKAYGTILAVIKGELVEITTFRRESRYSDQRHPDQVEFIREYLEDARRRDLTINALYFNPVTQELFDPVNGLADIKRKIIRFVGDPKKRINEDALRMIRAVRLATMLGFSGGAGPRSAWKLEKNTFAAIKTRAKFISGISGERIKLELDKLLLSKHRSAGIKLLDQIGLLKFILPEFIELKKIFHKSKKYHLEGSVYDHTLMVLDQLPENLDLLYAGIFHDIGKLSSAQTEFKDGEYVNRFRGHQQVSQRIFYHFADEYKFSKQSRGLVDWLIQHHDDRVNYRMMTEHNRIKYSLHPDFAKLVELWKADSAGNIRLNEKGIPNPGRSESVALAQKTLKQIGTKWKLIDKLSNGNFIMKETGIPSGIRIGQISEKIKLEVAVGIIKNEDEAKIFLKKISKST